MKLPKKEIDAEVAHQQQAVRVLRERRRALDLQSAQLGIATPPHITTEISDLTEQIRAREEEIATLETLAAADETPVTEVEYRAMLAEAWDRSSGRLKLAPRARLDWERLRLRIAPDRAL